VPVAEEGSIWLAGFLVGFGYHKAALERLAKDCSKADSFIRLMTAAAGRRFFGRAIPAIGDGEP
jgi:hypothetical protein